MPRILNPDELREWARATTTGQGAVYWSGDLTTACETAGVRQAARAARAATQELEETGRFALFQRRAEQGFDYLAVRKGGVDRG